MVFSTGVKVDGVQTVETGGGREGLLWFSHIPVQTVGQPIEPVLYLIMGTYRRHWVGGGGDPQTVTYTCRYELVNGDPQAVTYTCRYELVNGDPQTVTYTRRYE